MLRAVRNHIAVIDQSCMHSIHGMRLDVDGSVGVRVMASATSCPCHISGEFIPRAQSCCAFRAPASQARYLAGVVVGYSSPGPGRWSGVFCMQHCAV